MGESYIYRVICDYCNKTIDQESVSGLSHVKPHEWIAGYGTDSQGHTYSFLYCSNECARNGFLERIARDS